MQPVDLLKDNYHTLVLNAMFTYRQIQFNFKRDHNVYPTMLKEGGMGNFFYVFQNIKRGHVAFKTLVIK